MKSLPAASAVVFLASALFLTGIARSQPLKVTFPDSAGSDFGGRTDVSGMTLNFDNSDGSYELKIQSAAANSFRDNFRINVNLFNSDVAPSTRERAFFSKTLLDFTLGAPQGEMTITGTDPVLKQWQAGEIVVASGPEPLGAPSDGPVTFASTVTDLPVAGAIKGDAIGDRQAALIDWAQPPHVGPVWRQLFSVSGKGIYGDPDGDGFPGWAEAAFGTNPGDARSAVRPVIRRQGTSLSLDWSAVSGTRQQVESSPDLLTWQPLGSPITGTGALISIPITPSGTTRYFRVKALPALDSDGDGLDDLDEGLLGTNPLLADTDNDGFSDGNEFLTLHTDPLRGVQAPVIMSFPAGVSTPTAAITGTAAAGESITAAGGSVPVTATAGANGAFSMNVTLQQNRINRLTFTSTNAAGQSSPVRVIEILHDAQPPDVFVDFPGNNAQLYTATATIAGRVADALNGQNGLTVTVNAQPANVIIGIGTNGTFERASVPLIIGENQITVIARDSLNNTTTKSILVYRADPAGTASITAIAGSGQTGIIHRTLPLPVEVEVRSASGAISPGQPVTFRVIRSDGRLTPTAVAPGGGLTFQTVSDATGRARVFWTLGGDAGCGNNRLEVTTAGTSGAAYFCASAHPAPSSQINIGSGNNQIVETGGAAYEPLRAWVSDGCNGVAGVAVTFTVTGGGGKVNGQSAVTIPTTATGHAQVNFQLGDLPGNHTVEATFPGFTGSPAVFTLRGIQRTLDQPTSFTGIVQDNAGQPIGGARAMLRINGQWGTVPLVTTAPDGTFTIPDIGSSGAMRLLVSGYEATLLGGQPIPSSSFPSLEFDFVAVPNAVNSLSGPVLLPKMDPTNTVRWDGATDIQLTCKGIEGLQFTIRAGSMTRADGTKPAPNSPAFLSLNQVHHDDVPMPMPDGASPPFAWTFQPGGATFNPPVEIRYPNMSGLPPGAIAYFLTYDHAVEQFRIVSSGHITNDGAHIVTDSGSGLTLSGWGCNCPPYSVTGEVDSFRIKSLSDSSNRCNAVPADNKLFVCRDMAAANIGTFSASRLLCLGTKSDGFADFTAVVTPCKNVPKERLLWELRRTGEQHMKGDFSGEVSPEGHKRRIIFPPGGGTSANPDYYEFMIGIDSENGPLANAELDPEEITQRRFVIRVVGAAEYAEGLNWVGENAKYLSWAGRVTWGEGPKLIVTQLNHYLGRDEAGPLHADSVSMEATNSPALTLHNGAPFAGTAPNCVAQVPKYHYAASSEFSRILTLALADPELMTARTKTDPDQPGCFSAIQPTQFSLLLAHLEAAKVELFAAHGGRAPGEFVAFDVPLAAVGTSPLGKGFVWWSGPVGIDPVLFDLLFLAVGSATGTTTSITAVLERTETGFRIESLRYQGSMEDLYDFDQSIRSGMGTVNAVPLQIGWNPSAGRNAGRIFLLHVDFDYTWGVVDREMWPDELQLFEHP